MEWLAGLATEIRDKITHFMYDDMCHLRVKFYIIALAFLWYLLLPRNMLASHQGLREVTWQCSLQVKRCVLTISTSSMNLTFTFTFDRLLFCKQQPVIGLWLRGLKKQDDYCQTNTNPHNFPEHGPVNSVVCVKLSVTLTTIPTSKSWMVQDITFFGCISWTFITIMLRITEYWN